MQLIPAHSLPPLRGQRLVCHSQLDLNAYSIALIVDQHGRVFGDRKTWIHEAIIDGCQGRSTAGRRRINDSECQRLRGSFARIRVHVTPTELLAVEVPPDAPEWLPAMLEELKHTLRGRAQMIAHDLPRPADPAGWPTRPE